MKKLLLIALALALQAPALAQRDSVTVEIEPTDTCPTGWTQADRAVTKPARYFYVLPTELHAAFFNTHIGGLAEFLVSQSFVDTLWPTDAQQAAAVVAGQLRAEPATSGSVRTCSLP